MKKDAYAEFQCLLVNDALRIYGLPKMARLEGSSVVITLPKDENVLQALAYAVDALNNMSTDGYLEYEEGPESITISRLVD